MGQKIEAPKGHLRDLRFLLCSSAGAVVMPPVLMTRSLLGIEALRDYRLLMAEHRTSSIASKPRRASRAKGSRKPSAPRAPRSKSSKAATPVS